MTTYARAILRMGRVATSIAAGTWRSFVSIASWCALILPVGGCNLTISFSKPGPEFVGGMERAESSRCGASRDVFLELLGFRVGHLILANQT